jgi:hypothetical protein
LPKLQDHLLGRLLNREYEGDTYGEFSDADCNRLHIVNEQIFQVNTCSIHYTTYDVRRDYDLVNPKTHADIMVESPDPDTPFWYARVLGIFHANVWTDHPNLPDQSVCQMDFLWVRWFGTEPDWHSGSHQAKLPKIGFVDASDDFAFTFLDPAHVIRGCHLIPAFDAGRTSLLLPYQNSIAQQPQDANEIDDWVNFYVNMQVELFLTQRSH